MIYVTRRVDFSASHRLYNPTFSHEKNDAIFDKCNNVMGHGHNYILEVTVKGQPDPETGYVIDLKKLRDILNREIIDKVDHKHLNFDVEFLKGIIPTAENIAVTFWNIIKDKLPAGELHSLKLFESDNNFVEYFGEPVSVPRIEYSETSDARWGEIMGEEEMKSINNGAETHIFKKCDVTNLLKKEVLKTFPSVSSDGKKLFDSNGNSPITDEERAEMIAKLEGKFSEIFDVLRIDRNDPNSSDTPRRLSKMWVNELFSGRFEKAPDITVFPNRKSVDELIISKGIDVISVCSHHWQTISGTCAIGYMPQDYVLGLSKFNRIVNWFSRRGQIQEELGEQIADYLEELLQPKALGVVIKSKHYCMIARGVRGSEEASQMVTSVMRGRLGVDLNLRNEFLKLIE